MPFLSLRITSALAGATIVPAMFLSARALGLSRASAFVAAILVLTETLSALQVR